MDDPLYRAEVEDPSAAASKQRPRNTQP